MGNGWHGPQGKGAMRERRARKRAEAEERNARTPESRRRRSRLTITMPEPCGKKNYPEKRDATAVANHRGKRLGRPLRSYWCEVCSGWHLTKQLEEDTDG